MVGEQYFDWQENIARARTECTRSTMLFIQNKQQHKHKNKIG